MPIFPMYLFSLLLPFSYVSKYINNSLFVHIIKAIFIVLVIYSIVFFWLNIISFFIKVVKKNYSFNIISFLKKGIKPIYILQFIFGLLIIFISTFQVEYSKLLFDYGLSNFYTSVVSIIIIGVAIINKEEKALKRSSKYQT